MIVLGTAEVFIAPVSSGEGGAPVTTAGASLSDNLGQRDIDPPSFVIIGNTETPFFLHSVLNLGNICFSPQKRRGLQMSRRMPT